MTPAFIYQMGVVSAIAVGFVPQMVAAWQTIREAQQVRGHRVRGLRDLLPLIMPLLITALERAMQLAESMEARGFGGPAEPGSRGRRLTQQLAILGGLAALAQRTGVPRLLARRAACWPARCWRPAGWRSAGVSGIRAGASGAAHATGAGIGAALTG